MLAGIEGDGSWWLVVTESARDAAGVVRNYWPRDMRQQGRNRIAATHSIEKADRKKRGVGASEFTSAAMNARQLGHGQAGPIWFCRSRTKLPRLIWRSRLRRAEAKMARTRAMESSRSSLTST